MYPNDPICSVVTYQTVETKEINLFANHRALTDEKEEDEDEDYLINF